jgi:hypothetical protein
MNGKVVGVIIAFMLIIFVSWGVIQYFQNSIDAHLKKGCTPETFNQYGAPVMWSCPRGTVIN